jgi:hypothetical protein
MSESTAEERLSRMSEMEAECFHACALSEKLGYAERLTLQKIRAAVKNEQQRLRQVFLTIAELHGLTSGAVLLFEVAIRDYPCVVDATPEPPEPNDD